MDEFQIGGFRDVPAWHNKGITKAGGWTGEHSVLDAMVETKVISHRVEMLPITYVLPTGEVVESKKRNMLVRAPIEGVFTGWEEFKTVSKNYNFVPKDRMADILQPLADLWPLETIGILGKRGDRMLLTLKMEQTIPNEDDKEKHDHYLFIADDYRGGGSLHVLVTSVRVVCQNTWNMAFDSAENHMSFPHIGDPEKMLEFRIQLEKAALAQRAEAVRQFEGMMKFITTKEQRADVFEKIFPYREDSDRVQMVTKAETMQEEFRPELLEDMRIKAADDKKAIEQHNERMYKHRVNVAGLFNKFNNEFPEYADSAYALLNAVNEYADWRGGRGKDDRAMQVLYRGRASEKRHAYELINGIMNSDENNN